MENVGLVTPCGKNRSLTVVYSARDVVMKQQKQKDVVMK